MTWTVRAFAATCAAVLAIPLLAMAYVAAVNTEWVDAALYWGWAVILCAAAAVIAVGSEPEEEGEA